MAKPIATTTGICFAFPDLRKTPTPAGTVPMPYPNIAQLSVTDGVSGDVNAGGKPVILEDSTIGSSSGGEPGSAGPVSPKPGNPDCKFATFSKTVKANGKGIVRQGDTTEQDLGNSTGTVMVGLPTVVVGD